MRRVCAFAVLQAAALLALPAFAFESSNRGTITGAWGQLLEDGKIYDVVPNAKNEVLISNGASGKGSALRVAANASVAICIHTGVTLKVYGSTASGQGTDGTSGGAGILVPGGSSLIIFGDGALEAVGGNAASGGKGGDGQRGDSIRDDDGWGWPGRGGTGGYGGAGGGAGIGGAGGIGGGGGGGWGQGLYSQSTPNGNGWKAASDFDDRTWGRQMNKDAFSANGVAGVGGGSGGSGSDCGSVYALGFVGITAKTGGTGDGGGGGAWGYGDYETRQWGLSHYTMGGGGGGGGGGAGISAPYGIGGGGAAGGGGGQGGSGGCVWRYTGNSSRYWSILVGCGGQGGFSALSSKNGTKGGQPKNDADGGHSPSDRDNRTIATEHGYHEEAGWVYGGCAEHTGSKGSFNGIGSKGGTPGNNGKAGTVYKASTVTKWIVDGGRTATARETYALLRFNYRLHQDENPNGSNYVLRDCEYGNFAFDVKPPQKGGYVFLGYYYGNNPDDDDEFYFASDGTCMKKFYFYHDVDLMPYFVKYEDMDWTGVTVNGRDLAYRSGIGWRWKPTADGKPCHLATFASRTGHEMLTYLIEGENADGRVMFRFDDDCEVSLLGLRLTMEQNHAAIHATEPLFEVSAGKTVTLHSNLSNLVSKATAGHKAPAMRIRGTLSVTNLAMAATQLEFAGGAGCPGVDLAAGAKLQMGGGRLTSTAGSGAASGLGTAGRGELTVGGGTLQSKGGSSFDFAASKITITGGSVFGARWGTNGECSPRAVNASGQKLWCIRSAVPDSPGDETPASLAGIDRLEGYGANFIFPIDGRIYLWSTPQTGYLHTFTVDGMLADAKLVGEKNVDAYFGHLDVRVDGVDVGVAIGEGWRWSPASSNLTFVSGGRRVMDGANKKGEVHPVLSHDTELVMSGLTLWGYGVRTGVVDVVDGASPTIRLIGENELRGMEHFRGAGIAVAPQAQLTVTGESGAKRLVAAGGAWGAGIGGHRLGTGRITIGGGAQVFATGGFEGAGVGGGSGCGGGAVTVAGGASLTAVGGYGAAGVGAGAWAAEPGTLTGTATATKGKYAADVGLGLQNLPLAAFAADEAGASLVVTTLGDSGEGSLRAAVARAVALRGGAVTFAAGLEGEIALKSPIAVDLSVCVQQVSVSGEGRIRLVPAAGYAGNGSGGGAFLSAGGGELALAGLSFSGFETAFGGGAVRTEGVLTLQDCTFENCTAASYGGAVYAGPNALVTATNCRFAGNASGEASGGAVFARAGLRVERCTFCDCAAAFGGGGAGVHAPGVSAFFANTSFLGNRAGERGGGVSSGAGDVLLAACTLAANEGEGAHGLDRLVAASVLASGNRSRLASRPSDIDAFGGLTARKCTLGELPAGDLSDVIWGATPAHAFKRTGADGQGVREQAEVEGVVHDFMPLTHANKAVIEGCGTWRSSDWSSLGWTKRVSGTSTRLYGTLQTKVDMLTDQTGDKRVAATLLVGAVTAAAEKESLLVTTADDVVDLDDNLVSLREAFTYACSPDLTRRTLDGYAEVTFAAALFTNATRTATLTPADGVGRPALTTVPGLGISVTGPKDGSSLVLRPGADAARLLESDALSAVEFVNVTFVPPASGTGSYGGMLRAAGDLTLINCAFDGEDRLGTLVESTSGTLWVEQCTFRRNVGAGGAKAALVDVAVASGHALNCTVSGNRAANADQPLFAIRDGSQFDFANVTEADNGAGAVAVDAASGTGVNFVNAAFMGAVKGVADARRFKCWIGHTPAETFFGGLCLGKVNGVTQGYYRQLRSCPATTGGCYVFHDSYWNSVACDTRRTGSTKQPVRSLAARASTRVSFDVVGRPWEEGHLSIGSYAAATDEEYFDSGVIEVNSRTDTVTSDKYDGLISLRDAVDFAQAHPTFRDDAGNCTVKFADAFFTGGNSTIWAMRQIEVASGFENGTLFLSSPPARPVTLDGAGKYRLFHVGKGMHVSFGNFTFTNTLATTAGKAIMNNAGGALNNAGWTVVSNCAFRDCWAGGSRTKPSGHADGGAVATGAGGFTRLENCTVESCRACFGGGLYTFDGGTSVVSHCTFTGNRVFKGYTVNDPRGGGVCAAGTKSLTALVNCTVAANVADEVAGGVYAEGAKTGPVLYLLNTVVAGNVASNGVRDLHCEHGEVRLHHTIYGERNELLDGSWTDADGATSLTASEIFGRLGADGLPVPSRKTVNGVAHAYHPLNSGLAVAAKTAHLPDWTAVYYGETAADRPLFGSVRYVASAVAPAADQIGNPIARPFHGAVSATANAAARLARADGTEIYFDDLDTALAAAGVGDVVAVMSPQDAREEVSATLAAGVTVKDETGGGAVALMHSVRLAAAASISDKPWYKLVETAGGGVATVLDEATATPEFSGEDADMDLSGDGGQVSVKPANVKPLLWYGLGHSVAPAGPYAVDEGDWVRADEHGNLPQALTAPATGPGGFYRVMVRE